MFDTCHRDGGTGGGNGDAAGIARDGPQDGWRRQGLRHANFVASSRAADVTSHVAQNINAHRCSNIDKCTTRHAAYRLSQVVRKRVEEANGWIKEVGGLVQNKLRGVKRVEWMFVVKVATYSLSRLQRLLATG